MTPTYSFLILIALVICFFGLILAILLAGGIYIFSRFSKTQQQAGQALAEDDEAFFERSAAELYPLSAAALEDIASVLLVDGQAALGNLHYRGRLHSLSQSARDYLAFDLRLKFGQGRMLLRTSGHQLELRFGGIGVAQVQALAGERPFGLLVDVKNEVHLVNLQGQKAGCYQRAPLSAAGIAIEPARFNFKSYYGMEVWNSAGAAWPSSTATPSAAARARKPLLTRSSATWPST